MSRLLKGLASMGLGLGGGVSQAYQDYSRDLRRADPKAEPSFTDFWNKSPVGKWIGGSNSGVKGEVTADPYTPTPTVSEAETGKQDIAVSTDPLVAPPDGDTATQFAQEWENMA